MRNSALLAILTGCLSLSVAGCHGGLKTGGVNATISSTNFIAVAALSYYASVWPLALGQLGNDIVTVDDTLQNPTTHNIPYPCASGFGTIGWTDTDGSGTVDTGDSFTMDFTSCTARGALGDVSYTGRLTMTQFSLSGSPVSTPLNPWEFDAQFTAVNLSATQSGHTRVFNGGFSFTSRGTPVSVEAITITGDQLTGAAGSVTDVLTQFTLSEQVDRQSNVYNSRQVAATLNSGAYGLLTLATTTPFQGDTAGNNATPSQGDTAPNARAGVMTVTAADKSNLRMTSNSVSDVTLELDSSGNGFFDVTQQVAWSVIADQGRL